MLYGVLRISSEDTRSPLSLHSRTSGSEAYETMQDVYTELVREEDPRTALDQLEEDAQSSAEISAVCHDLLHRIGSEAFLKYRSFDTAISFHRDFCNSGYLHGIFESFFTQVEDPLDSLTTLCTSKTFLRRPFDLWQCYHGLGHGLMYLTEGDLEESLRLCDGQREEGRESCYNGVYMEAFNAEVLPFEQDLVERDPLDVCTEASVAKIDCYTYVATAWSQLREVSFEEMFRLCSSAEYGYDAICVVGIGSEAMKRNMLAKEGVFTLCMNAPSTEYRTMCTQGLVGMYLNQMGSYESGLGLCTVMPDALKAVCNERVASREDFFAPVDMW